MSQAQNFKIKVKDFAVSGETFDLVFDAAYQLYKTFPQPDILKLPEYYKSEDYISHTDHQRNLKERLYFFVKGYALKNKLKLIDSFKTESKKLLDFGCGTGDFLKTCEQNKWQVTGIEPNEKARKTANVKLNNQVFDSINQANFKEGSFDVITLWHVLEHLPNVQGSINDLKKLLKPDGVLVVAVPNYNSFDASYYKAYWAAWDVPRHLWHFSQFSILKLFGDSNMKVTQIKPLYFDAFYVSLLSEYYKSGIHNYFKAFWIGLRSNLSAWRSREYSSLIYIVKKQNN